MTPAFASLVFTVDLDQDLIDRVLSDAHSAQRESRRLSEARQLLDFLDKNEAELAGKIEKYLRRQIRRLVGLMNESNWQDADRLLNWQEEALTLKTIVRPCYATGWQHGSAVAQDAVEIAQAGAREAAIDDRWRGLVEADLTTGLEAASEAIEDALNKLTTLINETTAENIRGILREAIAGDLTLAETQERILAQMGGIEPLPGMDPAERALTIAQTEIVAALNGGARWVYENSGFLDDVNQQFDARTFNAAGEVVHSRLIMHPPAHPKCRCVIALDTARRCLVWIALADACPTCIDLEAESQAA